jgi:opacity protein-like surface antigen
MLRTLFAVLVSVLVFASTASAQIPGPAGKMVQFGLGGGVSVPVGNAQDALKEGFHVRGFMKVHPPALPFSLRGALGYQKFGLDASQLPVGTEGSGNILSGLGGISLGKSVGPLRPYVTASLGAFRVESKVDQNGNETSEHETKFGIDAGMGLEFKLMSLKGFMEARLENVYTDQGFNSSLLQSTSTQVVPVTFGLMF